MLRILLLAFSVHFPQNKDLYCPSHNRQDRDSWDQLLNFRLLAVSPLLALRSDSADEDLPTPAVGFQGLVRHCLNFESSSRVQNYSSVIKLLRVGGLLHGLGGNYR